MKISIVTISYNQAPFLEQAIRSVVEQDYPDVEYIVVDPGSTDGSRDIINRYHDRIDQIVLDPDKGPADGLNKGFERATGQIFGFLNSDDYLLPGCLRAVASAFTSAPDKGVDVLSGNAVIVNRAGVCINHFFSRRFSPNAFIYGAATIAQQSTFFRRSAFYKAGAFNIDNKVAWDGELWVDLALSGAKFGRIPAFLSAFRIYEDSITGSGGQHGEAYLQYMEKMFFKVKGRRRKARDVLTRFVYKGAEYAFHPDVARARLMWGPVIPKNAT